ncbi:MAG: hypothetical protein HOV81_14970 [Kofleriaceae bacterium]|nr:hypothetical protein [Kofleriaceae bacterium]
MAAAGCWSRPVSPPPPPLAVLPAPDAAVSDAAAAAPRYLIGENCLNKQLTQTHLFPRFLGGRGSWHGDAEEVRVPLREAPQHFNVVGFDGTVRGEMITTANAVGSDPRGFIGTYTGSLGVCGFIQDGVRGAMYDCVIAGACGLAVADVDDTHPRPRPIDITVATTCVANDMLIADLDRDGKLAAFPLAAFRDETEIEGVPYSGPDCPPRYTWYGTQLGPDFIDVLGAGDFDHDGSLELVIAIRSGASRSVAIYAPPKGSKRLDRLAVVTQ